MAHKSSRNIQFPVVVEKDEDSFYVVESLVLEGCYSQGKTLDEALKNIREVIELCLEEDSAKEFLNSYLITKFFLLCLLY
ncbi:MAG: type II toxin-antitoxin system HicB family antitoxin [Candidatus Altiarchaeota archaeon]